MINDSDKKIMNEIQKQQIFVLIVLFIVVYLLSGFIYALISGFVFSIYIINFQKRHRKRLQDDEVL